MEELYKILGKVSVTPAGKWDNRNSYERLDIVTHEISNYSYIAKKDVPEGTSINNTEYWQRIGSSGFKDNNIVVLFDVNPSTGELVQHNLESAIAQIDEQSRHPGLILGFYGKDDTGNLTWFLYQYIDSTAEHFDNTLYWVSLYNNVNKFKGYFTSEELLFEIIDNPTIGDYAYVGDTMEDSYLYMCNQNGEWTNTNTKAYQFANLFKAVHSKDFSELEYTIDEQYCDRAEKDALGNIIHMTYATLNGLQNNIFESIYKVLSQVTLPEGSINLEQLSESLKDYISSGGNINNYPDEEDLTIARKDNSRVIKFKDKTYAPLDFSGKGRKYLRKNMVDGLNVLEQHLFDSPNTIYIIQYDYCLNKGVIHIPENCTLKFEGGSFNGGTIVLNNTKIEGIDYEIEVNTDVQVDRSVSHIVNDTTFINITFEGTYAVGQQLFHKSLKIPIWWTGDKWITKEWMDIDVVKDAIDNKLDVQEFDQLRETIENDFEDTNIKIKNIENSIVDIDSTLDEHKNDIDVFKEKLEDIAHYHTANDTAIDTLDKEITDNTKDIIALNKRCDDFDNTIDILDGELSNKVNKVAGKQLSTEDFTTALKNKLEDLANYNDAELTEKVNQLKSTLDVIVNSNDTTAVIDTWKEVENFLAGITNKETLTGLLQDLKSEIVALCTSTYLPLAGGRIDSESTVPLKVSSTQDNVVINFYNGDYSTTNLGYVGYIKDSGIIIRNSIAGKVLGIKDDGTPHFSGKPLLYANGTSSQFLKADGSIDSTAYLPKSGGVAIDGFTVKSDYHNPLTIKGKQETQIATAIQYEKSDGSTENRGYVGYINNGIYLSNTSASKRFGIDDNGVPNVSGKKIWYEDNDGSGSGLDADLLDGKHNGQLTASTIIFNWSNTFEDFNQGFGKARFLRIGKDYVGSLPNAGNDNYIIDIDRGTGESESNKFITQLGVTSTGFYYRTFYNKSRNNTDVWKQIAFTDSNVASADKLTTKQLTNEDLNDLKTPNTSFWATSNNTCKNNPFGDGRAFGISVIPCSGSNLTQIIQSYSSVISYKRVYTGSTWSAWKRMLTEDDIASIISRLEALEAKPNIVKVTSLPSNPDSNTLYCIPE